MRVTAAVIMNESMYLIAQRKRGSNLELLWEFPGGKIEENETPKECLKRELYEEFGIEAHIGEYLASIVHAYEDQTIELMAFNVILSNYDIELYSHEQIAWVSLEELQEYSLADADKKLVDVLFRVE